MELIRSLAISENGFIFDPGTGNSYAVNPIGLYILEHLKDEKSPEEIKGLMLEKYDVENDTAEKDLLDFLGMLTHFRLIKQ